MDELRTLLGYAEKFRDTVRSSITLDEFRFYLFNLEEDASTLTDTAAGKRIASAVACVRSCDYAFRNHPDTKDTVVLPQVEKLIAAIKSEIQALGN